MQRRSEGGGCSHGRCRTISRLSGKASLCLGLKYENPRDQARCRSVGSFPSDYSGQRGKRCFQCDAVWDHAAPSEHHEPAAPASAANTPCRHQLGQSLTFQALPDCPPLEQTQTKSQSLPYTPPPFLLSLNTT